MYQAGAAELGTLIVPGAAFWGKAGHSRPPHEHTALPVHLIAVAASLGALLESSHARRSLCSAWGVRSIEPLMPWITFVAALHDLGKIDERFQMKRPDVVDWIVGGGAPTGGVIATAAVGFDHSVEGGMALLPCVLGELGGELGEAARKRTPQKSLLEGMFQASFAHHGYHPASAVRSGIGSVGWLSTGPKVMALVRAAWQMSVQVHGEPREGLPPPKRPAAAMHLLAGWIALADWIGSDETGFPFLDCVRFAAEFPSADAWVPLYRVQLERARHRIQCMGLAPVANVAAFHGAVMGGYRLRDVQSVATAVAQRVCDGSADHEGGLVLIEAPMGVGKTEAALLCAGVFIRKERAQGLAFGLPAQASANMLFRRMAPLTRKVYGLQAPNLLHGGAAFARQRLTFTGEEDGQEAAMHLDEWVTDDNKKGFLAPVSAATVDQMELAAMHSKHAFVRFAALSRNVVVIDEIHAFDAYVQVILQNLLRLLGAAGTPTVLLTATLPDPIRQRLLAAYNHGAGWPEQVVPVEPDAYPVIVSLSAAGGRIDRVPWSDASMDVRLQLAPDEQWLEIAWNAAQQGLCVAVLANTVKSALRRAKALRAVNDSSGASVEIVLLHSRFRSEDRLRIQSEIERFAGKSATPEDRRGRIIVATQVLEQSIDIDVDLMLSEPAPMDLLLQRMGRLHRHRRPERTCEPRFVVIDPSRGRPDVEPDWFAAARQFVYAQSGKLTQSLELVRAIAARPLPVVRLPQDIPLLVREVYGSLETDDPTQRQKDGDARGGLVSINTEGTAHGFANDAKRSPKTRDSDGDESRIVFVTEDVHSCEWFVATESGPVALPDTRLPDGQVSHRFLAAVQPWLIKVPRHGKAWEAMHKSTHTRAALENDWRFGRPVREPVGPPPFLVVPTRRVSRMPDGRVCITICEDLRYDSREGLHHAEDC